MFQKDGELQQLQTELENMTARVCRLESQGIAQTCALQCLLAHWGQTKETLAAALAAEALRWDANYEQWPEPRGDRYQWRAAMDALRENLK